VGWDRHVLEGDSGRVEVVAEPVEIALEPNVELMPRQRRRTTTIESGSLGICRGAFLVHLSAEAHCRCTAISVRRDNAHLHEEPGVR
jgi:hypothetical protein